MHGYNKDLSMFLELEGIKHETSCVYTLQQNGLAEQKIEFTVEKCRVLMLQCNVLN